MSMKILGLNKIILLFLMIDPNRFGIHTRDLGGSGGRQPFPVGQQETRNNQDTLMNQDLALIVLATCLKSARDIGDLARLIPSDDKDIKIGIASSVHQIHEELIGVVFDRFPSLEEMERRLEDFGRYI